MTASSEITDAELEQHISEVRNADGDVIGYQVDAQTRATLFRLAREMARAQGDAHAGLGVDRGVQPQGAVECAAAIVSFIVLAVFPVGRVAKLAVRLAKMVNKYGASKVAQIFTRAYKGSDRTAIKELTELAAALAGIDQLKACGLRV